MSFWVGQAKGYDASSTDSLNCKGYTGLVSDGVYIYYAPNYDGWAYHGRVLRQKIFAIFTDSGTWDAYNAQSTDSLNCKGYSGAVFDGRYIYFAPDNNGSYHGNVLRYDTTLPFTDSDAWAAYNAASTDSLDCKGFSGAVFDGRYIYFVPNANGAYNNVLRYDTTLPFTDSDAWDAYAIGGMASGNAKGYWGGTILRGFLYLSPHAFAASPASAGFHGNIIRFDTTKPFKSSGSWETFDAATVNSNLKKLGLPCTDGKYVYFSEDEYNYVLRYDADKPFDSSGSYSYFDLGTMIETCSCRCVCVQGDYLLFAGSYADIAVYNRNLPFASASSWALKQCRIGQSVISGWHSCRSDPNYIYLSPKLSGTVGRVRVSPCPGSSAPQPGETEDLTTYCIESVSTNSSRCTASGIENDESCACFYDYGFEFFNEVEIYFEVQLNSIITGAPMGGTPLPIDIYLLSLGNTFSMRPYNDLSSVDLSASIYVTFNSSGDVTSRKLCLVTGNGSSSTSGYTISEDTTYYCKLTRSGTTATLRIYSDAARTNLLSTQNLTISTQKWRFVYATRGHDDTDLESLELSWWVQNIEIADW